MYISLLLTIFCCACGVLSDTFDLPCKTSDQLCLGHYMMVSRAKILDGIPELGIESADPLYIKKIEGNLSKLNYKFFNTTFIGYKDCVLSKLHINITSTTYDMNCPKITMRGKYDIKGKLLSLPIEGDGDVEIITGKYLVHVAYQWSKQKGEDGKLHMNAANIKLKCVPQSQIMFEFKNLFNGQKDSSDAVLKFAHDNWREVAEEIQEPIWNAAVEKFLTNVNKYLSTIPLESFLKS